MKGLQILDSSFPVGQLSPYQVISVLSEPYTIRTKEYFNMEASLIKDILATESQFVDPITSISALTYQNGKVISYDLGVGGYLNASSSLYNSGEAVSYRSFVNGNINTDQSACLFSIETTVNPNSQQIVPFITSMRSKLKQYANNNQFTR